MWDWAEAIIVAACVVCCLAPASLASFSKRFWGYSMWDWVEVLVAAISILFFVAFCTYMIAWAGIW